MADHHPIPPSIPKAAAPFLARAKELAQRDPVMAYWCKFKAAQMALDQMPGDDAGREYLGNLLGELESAKANLADNELVTDDLAGSAYVFNFASKVFDAADAADREGRATRVTAKEFLAASVFFDILSIFGALETDVSEKITYSKWKATQIAKAFREGRAPTPGPAGGLPATQGQEDAAGTLDPSGRPYMPDGPASTSSEDVARQLLGGGASGSAIAGDEPSAPPLDDAPSDFSLPSVPSGFSSHKSLSNDSGLPIPPSAPYDLPSTPSRPPLQPRPTSVQPTNPRPAQPSLPPTPMKPHHPPTGHPQPLPPGVQDPTTNIKLPPPAPVLQASSVADADQWRPERTAIDPVAIGNAQKRAKWAISALNYEDIETAKKELRAALDLIGG